MVEFFFFFFFFFENEKTKLESRKHFTLLDRTIKEKFKWLLKYIPDRATNLFAFTLAQENAIAGRSKSYIIYKKAENDHIINADETHWIVVEDYGTFTWARTGAENVFAHTNQN